MCVNVVRRLENMDLVPEEEGGNLFLVNGSMTPLRSAGAAYQTYDEKLVRNFMRTADSDGQICGANRTRCGAERT